MLALGPAPGDHHAVGIVPDARHRKGEAMHTNFDQLARLKIEEHEAFARRSHLQRVARQARSHRPASAGRPRGWVAAHRRLIAMPAIVSIGTAAIVVLAR